MNLLLESPLILHEVPQLQEIRDIVRETKHREDRKQILQAFQIPSLEGVSSCDYMIILHARTIHVASGTFFLTMNIFHSESRILDYLPGLCHE